MGKPTNPGAKAFMKLMEANNRRFDPAYRLQEAENMLRRCAEIAGIPWPPVFKTQLDLKGRRGASAMSARRRTSEITGRDLSDYRSRPLSKIEEKIQDAYFSLGNARTVLEKGRVNEIFVHALMLGKQAEQVRVYINREWKSLQAVKDRRECVRQLIEADPGGSINEMVAGYERATGKPVKAGSTLEKRLFEDFAVIRQDLGLA